MRGFNLNNLGNIRKSDTAWQGKVDSTDDEFEQFATPEDGLRAMMKNLQTYQSKYGDKSLREVLNRYAPSTENDTDGYIQFVADRTGVDPDAELDLFDGNTLIPLTKAMVRMEQGKDDLVEDDTYHNAYARTQENSDKDAELDLFGGSVSGTAAPAAPRAARPAPVGDDPRGEASGGMRTAFDQFMQGATAGFSDEITDPIGAALSVLASDPAGFINGEVNDPFLAEEIAGARESTNKRLKRQKEDSPWISGGANLAGSVVGSAGAMKAARAATPARAASAIAKTAAANPLKTAALLGSGSTGLYAAGEAEGDLADRAGAAILPAGVGMVAGPAGYKLAQGGANLIRAGAQTRAGQAVTGAIEKAGDFIDDFVPRAAQTVDDPIAAAAGGAVPSTNPMQMAGIFDEGDLARLEQGKVLPLTAGDRTQDVVRQRMEQIAAEQGSKPMLAARNQTQEAAYKPFVNALGEDQILDVPNLSLRTQSEVEKAADIVRGRYDEMGRRVNAAYQVARETGEGVGISALAIKDDLLGNIDNFLTDEAYRVGEIPKLDAHIDDIRQILEVPEGEKFTVSSVNLKQMEAWKKRLNRTIGNTMEPADQRILKNIGRQYDDFLSGLADDAIVNGDEAAINAFKSARGLAKERFDFYEADKQIAKILDNRELTGQQLVNTLYGASKISGKGDSGNLLAKMVLAAGDRGPEMQEALKRGALSKILQSSLSGVKNPENLSRDMVSYANMKKSLGNLMAEKEIFEEIFDSTEQEYFKTMYKDLELLSSKQKGAINNSSSGAYIADFLEGFGKFINNPMFRSIPAVGAVTTGVQKGLSSQAASVVTGKAEKGLEEFIINGINSIDAPAVYYGSVVGGSAVDPIGNLIMNAGKDPAAGDLDQEPIDGGMRITVHPRRQ
ncbi:MAG: hypothetical protein E6Q97_14880 [Desulfurellales bacterium]|nr:MAG: hypothetical protein E6Q97_14880 [Desulfurellales bacterium]